MDSFSPLKLKACDLEDLQVIASHLQDSLMPVMAMIYDTKTQTFTLLANRFCWEREAEIHDQKELYHRVHAGLCFMKVKNVYADGLHPHGAHRNINLLTIHAEKNEESSFNIYLICSGKQTIKLCVEDICCYLADLDHPWPTRKKPTHIHEHVENYLTTQP